MPEFYPRLTAYDVLHTKQTPTEFYRTALLSLAPKIATSPDARTMSNQLLSEYYWIEGSRPYYNVWPGIVQPLMNLPLDVIPSLKFRAPVNFLLFRFQPGTITFQDHSGDTVSLRSVLFSYGEPHPDLIFSKHPISSEEVILWFDWGETDSGDLPVFVFQALPLKEGLNVEQALAVKPKDTKGLAEGLQIPDDLTTNVIRLVLACCLLGDDELISPDILGKDRAAYDEALKLNNAAKLATIVERAKRRGKLGWDIGRNLTVSPHWRRSHPCLVWTEKGREVPKIVLRRGHFIHKETIKKMPSGYEPE